MPVTYQDLCHEFRLTNDGDSWGTCMAWLFAIADYQMFELDVGPDPQWEFRPSPMGPNTESFEYQALVELEPAQDVLERFGASLWRLSSILKEHGKDY